MSKIVKDLNQQQGSAQPDSEKTHYLTFPFAISERPDGGLPNVIMNEAKNSAGKKVVMFSTDQQDIENFDGIRVVAADRPQFTNDLINLWFGTGYWSLLHPKAHTEGSVPLETLRAMYDAESVNAVMEKLERQSPETASLPKFGSQEFLHAYVKQYGPQIDAGIKFNQSFESGVAKELARAQAQSKHIVFNFQDYFFHNLIEVAAPKVKEYGGLSTYHLHTTVPFIPNGVEIPSLIAGIARAASATDVVLTHTEVYNERLRSILDRLDLPHPEYRTFALGIDEEDLARRESRVTPGNYTKEIQGFEGFSERQKNLIHAAFRAEAEGVPHQFGIYDRMDPIKGLDVVFTAIDKFLEEERSYLGMDGLKQKYRFFAVTSLMPDPSKDYDHLNFKAAYANHATKIGLQLEAKWPGIFVISEGFSAKHRDLIVALMRDRTVITGGAEDGLNQVVMESSFINRNNPTGIIAGNNIGFVLEMTRAGLRDNMYTFQSGNVAQLKNNIRQVALFRGKNPGHLVLQKRELNGLIATRNASMLVSE